MTRKGTVARSSGATRLWGGEPAGRHQPSSRTACSWNLAPPLDAVLVFARELLDRLFRLGDLDAGDLAVEAAPRPLPRDLLAEPGSFEVVDDQARHVPV